MSYEFVEYGEDNTLKDSQEIYKTIFENSAVAITVTDENEKIISWNKYAEDLLGMTRDDLYNKPVESLYLPEEWKKIRAENIREKGMQHHLETKILRKNNEPLDVDISLSVLKNNEGKVLGSIGVIRDISEQMHNKERLESIMENADDSIYLLDKDCRYILVNKELLSRLNLSEEEVIGKKFGEIHSPEETQEFISKINWVFENGKATKDEHKVSRLGQWFLRTLSPVKDSITGQTIAVAVISKDITDWKKTEHELQASEERYRTIFENSAVAIMLSDENEKIISWNKYAEDLLGMTRDDLYNKPVESLYLPEEWKKIRAENIREKGMQHHLETKILRKNNEPLDVDISLSVLKNNEGSITGAIGVIKDISERVQAQEKLSYEHSLFQALLDNVPDSIYFKDENNRFILVNKAKAEHSNVSPEDMIGKTDYDFLPEHQARKTFENDNNIMKTGQPIIDEVEKLTGKDGSERWVSVTKIPRYSSEGKIIGTMGISRDVTKRVKETKETEKYKKVAIGQNLRIIELRDRVKDLITEMEKDK